ncbi:MULTISPECIES: transglycosylase domain-containing protein [Methylosinus]|uniref:Penicillin-binding protein n=1 Tax=Methylosinus trichosporium (strain ATCC 35070 / NCIMB 11131 / UNIQEM 75 / OB3b) TaxID=595536 RepID=A0A2D2D4P9_METT3|nr:MULTISPECIES: PBP1A family penicillin-binding protein [Methylosinus]ATQ69829.1 penicillin-binding protein [Methylosinus trichosporium OB3b]OBS52373.1 penicillin-binding protein [Methylosinus sp. 3S-1]
MTRDKRRREPRFAEDGPGDLRADPSESIGMAKRKAKAPAAEEAPPPPPPKKRRRGSLVGGLVYWGLVASIWGGIGAAGLTAYYAAQLPPIDTLAVPKRPPNIAILASDGSLLANRGDTGGAAVRLKDLPAYLPKAFVAIEDRRFYSHWGIDPVGIGRALSRNIIGHGAMQGGSTLTQQLAKNLFLTQERTVSRKIQEAILALWLEHKYSKDQILELYLNRVYFGSGAYGVEAAAQRYFGHPASAVTLSEAAVLAGLMKAPSKLAPDRNPEGASERAGQVVTAMAQEGHISESMAKAALSHPARARREQAAAGSANYAADYVMDMLDDTIGAIDQDIVVTTTLNRSLQTEAERALADELDKKGAKFGVSQGALVALDPNGAIRALVGGRNYADSQFNRAVSAKRQPGSAFKPFVYLAGLEHGLTPDTIREDGPINVKGWQPENYSHEYFGPVSLTRALALSLNTVAVRVGLEVGPKTVVKTAHRLGVNSELQPNASISLGTSEVTPLELVSAYAPFANGGIGVQTHIISKVKTASGKQLYARKGSSNGRVIEPQNVAMMNTMMEETLSTGTARKAELPGWRAAGKTGTSQDFRDAWFIGYTPHLVAGVWLGNDDNSPTKKVSGGNLPVEVWSRFMKAAHQGVPVAALPSGIWRQPPAADSSPFAPLLGLFSSDEPAEPPRRAREARPAARTAEAQEPGGAVHGLEALLPPADIPDARARPRRAPPAEEKNIFEKLFGG